MDKLLKKRILLAQKNKEQCVRQGQAPMNDFKEKDNYENDLGRQQAARRRKNENVNLALMEYTSCKKCGKFGGGLFYVQTIKTDWIVCKHCGCKVKVKDVLKSIVKVTPRKNK